MIAPDWFQVKFGPLFRGEGDLRHYGGQFRPAPSEISGIQKHLLLAACHAVGEPADSNSFGPPANSMVVFEGMQRYFEHLNGHNAFLAGELQLAVRPQLMHRVQRTAVPPIGIHVRLGDFAIPQSDDDLIMRGGVRSPMSWYLGALRYIRSLVGNQTPAFVVSDGKEDELAPVLAEPEVSLIRTGFAVSDLLILSKARLIIATGGSSYSAWASFLGEAPVISVPGQSLTWFNLCHKRRIRRRAQLKLSAPRTSEISQCVGWALASG